MSTITCLHCPTCGALREISVSKNMDPHLDCLECDTRHFVDAYGGQLLLRSGYRLSDPYHGRLRWCSTRADEDRVRAQFDQREGE